MQTLPQPAPPAKITTSWPALTRAMTDDTSTQCEALRRWHNRSALTVLDHAIAEHPRYPLILGGQSR